MKKEVYNYYVNYDNQLLNVKNENQNNINHWMINTSILSVVLSFLVYNQSKVDYAIFSFVLAMLSMFTFKISCSIAIEDIDTERDRIANIIDDDKMNGSEKLDKMSDYVVTKKMKIVDACNFLTILFSVGSIILSYVFIYGI